MIKNFRGEVWKTLHKEEWEDRFVYKVSNYGRLVSFLKNKEEGELIGTVLRKALVVIIEKKAFFAYV